MRRLVPVTGTAEGSINREWLDLRLPSQGLRDARLQCHHAVQINTRLARGFVAPQDDDSHTSLTWDFEAEALTGRRLSALDRYVCLGLRVKDLTLLFDGLTFALGGQTFDDALAWLGERLRERGLDPAPLAKPIHFELENHPLLHGARFDASSFEPELAELARYYANAAMVLEELHQPVRCWPHHFDIATLIADGEKTIGAGLSPGDSSYAEPYFYVSPTPAPESLPALNSRGHWHQEGWVGAALPASRFIREDSQETEVRTFLDDAIALLSGDKKIMSCRNGF